MSDNIKNILEWVECIVIAIVLAILIRYFVGTPTIVKQESMYPTLKPNERLILNRLTKTAKKMPERGDIITFEAPSMANISIDNVDLKNPVAKYENQPTSILGKFSYYVLEWHKTSYIKRVIGLPGETIRYYNGQLFINDSLVNDTYGYGTTSDFEAVTLDEDEYFLMGDNREISFA